ncbi:MAG: ATP-dependent DNA helicase RecG [Verrucomicrobiota bacterium]
MQFSTPLADIPKLNTRERTGLAKAGFRRVSDLLTHFPRRYEDRRQFDSFPNAPSNNPFCINGIVTDRSLRRFGRGKQIFEATIEESEPTALSNPVVLRWFNLPWIHKNISVDHELIAYGKPKLAGKRLVIDHPEYEILKPDFEGPSIHIDRITPIYPLTAGVSQRPLRTLIHRLLHEIEAGAVPDLLPHTTNASAIQELTRYDALHQIHFPDTEDQKIAARRYFAFEEFFALQLNVARRRLNYLAQPGACHATNESHLLNDWLADLPFALTGAQKRAVAEIRRDLQSDLPMHRLLQGDVGSGKTAVAIAAMLEVVEAGYQAAFMAPTQILAEQHYLTLQKQLAKLDLRISLRTSSKKEDDFLELQGAPQIIVGTHALLHDGVSFENLGLAIIDEQHKFGVAQRAALIEQGTVPDVLVMTATPIPRTLTMTVYGDLDVSIIDELPAGRGKIITAVRPTAKTKEAAKFIREHLENDRQAYIVYPLIDESESLNLKAATTEYENWAKRLDPFEVALLHGRIPPDDKETIMSHFRDGRIAALVATTVIEVGVDVPNANIMIIDNAERFGLAQLHQLRGRIGRGAHKSYCILLHGPKASEEALEKLAVLEGTTDGFEIAEADLKLRGPGELLGTAQSGLPGLQLGDLIHDTALVKDARTLADHILAEDPSLTKVEYQALKSLLERTEESLIA